MVRPAVEAAIPELEALARSADREGIARALERLLPEARLRHDEEREGSPARPAGRAPLPEGDR